jgi:hypothetical protein
MSAGCQSIDTVPAGDGFHAVFLPNAVARLENNNAKAIPVPGVVIGITVRKDGYNQEGRIPL